MITQGKEKELAQYISNWMETRALSNGRKCWILGLSGGIDSALVALLCKQTKLPLVCVNMPCHSSSSAYDRAKAFADEYGLSLVKVDLSQAHESIMGQAFWEGPGVDFHNKVAVGGLRSGLRAPLLSYYSNVTSGLVVGTGNRSEDNLTRYYQKVGDGCVDLSPIADLFKSEVRQLFAFLATKDGVVPIAAQAILDAKPTADLWGPDQGQEDEKELGMSYDDVEWADREDMKHSIVRRVEDPAKHYAWQGYTAHQKMVVAKVHAMEKATRHKYNPNLPVCEVRNLPGMLV